jgi:hypothetical protein
MVKSESGGGGEVKSAKPMPFKLTKLVPAAEAESETSVHALFDPIITEIREYLLNLAQAEQGEGEE